MRWGYTRFFVLFFAFVAFCGLARADESATIANITKQLGSSALPDEERIRLLFARGLSHDRQSDFEGAIADYSAILEIAPNNYAALNNRANAYRRQGALRDAKRDYLASLVAGNPRPAYSEYGLGQIAEAEGELVGAREHYRRAVASDPAYRLAAQRLAELGPGEPFSAIHLTPPKGGSAQNPDRIVLRPPAPRQAAPRKPGAQSPAPVREPAAKRGWTQVAQATGGKTSDVVLVLRPTILPEGAPAPAKAPAKPKRAARPGGSQKVQLGAWRTKAEAEAGLKAARAAAGKLLAGRATEIVRADIPGKGRYFRLRAGPSSRTEALKLCASLKARGVDCILAPR